MTRLSKSDTPFAVPRLKRVRLKRGFALVVTLSLMMLLVIVAVGLLGLSSISLRSSGQGQARAIAQTNARMALQMAVGELQKALGPDQRISARASLIHGDKGESNVVGAWQSWRWNPFGTDGPEYSAKQKKFQSWLVSTGNPEDARNVGFTGSAIQNAVDLIQPPDSAELPVAKGEPAHQLRASVVTVRNSTKLPGGMAWAVMDESLKLPVNLPEPDSTNPSAVNETAWKIAMRTAAPRAKPEVMVPKLAPSTTVVPERIISLPTAVLASGADSAEILGRQDEMTPYSLGLQTDVVNGGFKKDLTTAFETAANFDLATIFGSPTVYGSVTEGGPRWSYLRSHYQHYKRASGATSGTPKIVLGSNELKPAKVGVDRSPATERLLPVIAKLQIMFSVVTHFNHIQDRVNFFNTKGNPQGNERYGCPHLVYDPVVTLYNPYDVAIELPKLRVRIWDPPVLFGFKKNNVWLRDQFATANGKGFQGLARFQIKNEDPANTPEARKYFTLLLTEKTSTTSSGVPGKTIRMEPGEVKVFSPWVENNWNWELETSGGYTPRVFFDWDANNDLGNVDRRSAAPAGLRPYGVMAVTGWDARAGLQTDHLSMSTRPQATRYDFEIQNNWNGGWLGIKREDTFSVYAKPGRTVSNTSSKPDFQVDVLAGQVEDPFADILRSYTFRYKDVEGEISGKSPAKIISRTFLVDDLLQTPKDFSTAGKSPFGILTMSAKTTKETSHNWLDVSMPWLHNHPVVEGGDTNTNYVGSALDSYDLRFQEVQDFNTFPGVELDGSYGFYGATVTANRGVSNVPMFRVPLLPANSLGEMIPANLAAASALPRVTHPLGSSRAHPLVPSNAVSSPSTSSKTDRLLDHSYLLNDALWDSTFFSTVATFSGGLSKAGSRKGLLSGFLSGGNTLLNSRLVPILSTRDSATGQADELDQLNAPEFAAKIGSVMGVAGAFNVNSDSVAAWRGFLSSMRNEAVRGWKNYTHNSSDKTSFPRTGMPLGGDADNTKTAPIDIKGQIRWAGFRALTDDEIENLAEAIVKEIRLRGAEDQAPSLSLAEFINRRIGPANGTHTLSGILEAAIKASNINQKYLNEDSNDVTGSEAIHPSALTGLVLPDARIGKTAEGAPSVLTQGDLLMPLAGVITPRGDTFTIRSYGESRDAAGKPVARAWCEAVVQRLPEYLDLADDAADNQSQLQSQANLTFGRRFVITSFRWLDADEI